MRGRDARGPRARAHARAGRAATGHHDDLRLAGAEDPQGSARRAGARCECAHCAARAYTPRARAQIKDAAAQSEKHGASSLEARLSWETVEELHHRIGLQRRLEPTLEEQCELPESDADADCAELHAPLERLRAVTAKARSESLEDLRAENAALKAKLAEQ